MLQRLRVTWLVRHLEIGTPPRLLMAISGLSTFSSLGIYVQELSKPTDDQIRALCALRLS